MASIATAQDSSKGAASDASNQTASTSALIGIAAVWAWTMTNVVLDRACSRGLEGLRASGKSVRAVQTSTSMSTTSAQERDNFNHFHSLPLQNWHQLLKRQRKMSIDSPPAPVCKEHPCSSVQTSRGLKPAGSRRLSGSLPAPRTPAFVSPASPAFRKCR